MPPVRIDADENPVFRLTDHTRACLAGDAQRPPVRQFVCVARQTKGDAARHPLNVVVLILCAAVLNLAATTPVTTHPASPTSQPSFDHIPLSPLVTELLNDPITLPSAKLELKIFHGQWDDLPSSLTPRQQAQLAWLKFDLTSPALLKNAKADLLWRAEAALYRGQPEQTLALLLSRKSSQAAVLRARADEQLGRQKDAIAELLPIRQSVYNAPPETGTNADVHTAAAAITAQAKAIVMLARLQGRPAADYQLAMNLLGKAHDDIDPLYWPAYVAEANLLMRKDNRREALDSLKQALSLNPNSEEAWYALGLMMATGYNFGDAETAVKHLRAINPHHLLAAELQIRIDLIQHDIPAANVILAKVLKKFPNQRIFLALKAAAEALAYQPSAMRVTLARFDELSPGSGGWAQGDYIVGKFLSRDRQYAAAAKMLQLAIARQPGWSAPKVELGLLMMQWGKLHQAAAILTAAAQLDPFNRQVENQLALVRELLTQYARIDTPHFIIRYKPGIDAVLARDMPAQLEKIYAKVTADFQHKPARKTRIDLMPNDRAFAVRITGMPDIWTISACTGDVIALTPPRHGAHQRSPFNWVNVISHEFTHTVTLDQTHNRVPHWFTEACAVSEQTNLRSYNTCQLLAWALREKKLFTLTNINWGFVRPTTPYARQLAYAQANWMLQYITARWTHQAIIDLLTDFGNGLSAQAAMRKVTGEDSTAFMSGFKQWAHQQVKAWGLAADDADLPRSILAALDGKAPLPDHAMLTALLKQHPDNPDLLELSAKVLLQGDDDAEARKAVLRYAVARPVDPWPQRALLKLAIKTNQPRRAVAPLKRLSQYEHEDGQFPYQLAKVQRALGDLSAAQAAILQAVHTEPYNPAYRQFAATIALQLNQLPAALHQLQAMAMLEPKQAINHLRLAALYKKLNDPKNAAAEAKKAKALNPELNIDRFL